jgi:hypothetical protein
MLEIVTPRQHVEQSWSDLIQLQVTLEKQRLDRFQTYINTLPTELSDVTVRDFTKKYKGNVDMCVKKVKAIKAKQLKSVPETPRVTRATRGSSVLQFIPETPRTQRRAKRGESLFSMNGSPISMSSEIASDDTKRRISVRQSMAANGQGMELLQGPTLTIPLNDAILDFDLNCPLKDITSQLGNEGVKDLKETLLRMKQQSEALLAQFE